MHQTLTRAFAGISSLASLFFAQALHEFILEITFASSSSSSSTSVSGRPMVDILLGPRGSPGGEVRRGNRAGYDALVEIVRDAGIGRVRSLRLGIDYPWKVYEFVGLRIPKTKIEDARDVVEVVERAVEKMVECGS